MNNSMDRIQLPKNVLFHFEYTALAHLHDQGSDIKDEVYVRQVSRDEVDRKMISLWSPGKSSIFTMNIICFLAFEVYVCTRVGCLVRNWFPKTYSF